MDTGSVSVPVQERLNRRDWGLIGLAVLISLISLAVVARYFHLAFPEASIDFHVTRSQSATLARQFLEARGFTLAGNQHAAQFAYDDSSKVFLERELGLARTDALLRQRVHLWRWENRWFRPLQKEEYRVAVTPGGQVVGFDHEITDEAVGASLTEAAARARAEQFLGSVMHLDPATLEFVRSAQQTRPHRTDYTFTWKDRAPLVSDPAGLPPAAIAYLRNASYRREVRVQGDQVGAYREFLQVPEDWARAYDRLRSQNDTAGGIDTALLLVLGVAMLAVLTLRIRRSDVRWRTALWIGGTGAVLSFLAALNGLPGSLFDYDTTQSFSAFLTRGVLLAVLSGVGVGVFLTLLTAAAEPLYRERFTRQLALPSYLTWRGLRSKPFFLSVVLGIMLAFFFFAYQTVFYLVANHFGAWAPADVPYDSLLNTRFPWIFVLLGGFFPAIFEEFAFRMLAIPLFEKWFRWLWVAVIAASFLWGFGHATYPNQPFYIRGVEVGLGGVLLSWIMIRYGILTTVVWHYTVDALYTAMLLLRSHSGYLRWSGGITALIAALPLLVAGIAYWRAGGFTPAASMTNAAAGSEPAPVEATAAPPPALPDYESISVRSWTWGIVVALVLLSAFAVRVPQWRSVLRFQSTPAGAEATARAFLQNQGYSLAGYRTAIQLVTPDSMGGDVGAQQQAAQSILFHRHGRQALMQRFSREVPAAYWRARFFRPLQEEEFVVAVRPSGKRVLAFVHKIPEDAPGASPTLAQARQTAEAFAAAQGLPVTGMALRTAELEERKARADADFVWEAPDGSPLNSGEVRYRVEVQTTGQKIAVFRSFFHIPEAELRSYQKSTFASTLLTTARVVMVAGILGLLLWLFFRFARKANVPWRWVLGIAGAAGLASLLDTANRLPELMARYPTQIPWSAWVVVMVIGVVGSGVGAFLISILLITPVEVTAPDARAIRLPAARLAWATDALGAAVLGVLWTVGWNRVLEVISVRLHRFTQVPLPDPPATLTNLVPGLSDLLRAPVHALWLAALLGVLLPSLLYAWRHGDRWLATLGVALLWAGQLSTAHTLGQFLLMGLLTAVTLVLLFSFAAFFLRTNALAWFSAALLPLLIQPALSVLGLGVIRYDILGIILLLCAAAWLAWLGWLSWRAGEGAA